MSFLRSRGLRVLLAASLLLLVGGLGGAVGIYLALIRDLPDLRSVADYRPPLASRVLDAQGRPIGVFFVERRELTPLERIPDHVVRAFVAGEDATFFQHSGIDLMSILRAAWVNVRAGGEIRQGGSTITQQMVKGLLLSPERNLRRKLREMILARDIEKRFTKQEILFLYLNQIYLGHGAYGIGEAARTYFGKDVSQLTVSEGAQLAGLPKAPTRYSPHLNPKRAEERRRYVLERMREEGYLDEATWRAALDEPIALAGDPAKPDYETAAYFTEEVRRALFERLGGDTVLTGGLTIETSLELPLQRAAVAAVRHGLEALSKRSGYRGPLRRVAPAEIPAELERLAEQNTTAPPAADPDAPPEALAADPDVPPEVVAAESPAPGAPPALSGSGPFEGVVLAVDVKQQSARIGFGAGIEGHVGLADVAWARPPDPDRAPSEVSSIDRVFAVGDVAPFAPVTPDAEGAAAADGLRVSLVQEPEVQGALLSIDVESQQVLALVGGYDYARSQFDRVTQASRQPGSSFKPIIYGAALARDYTPASIVFDRPVVYTDDASGFVWRPQNYGRSFYGPITLREALARSVNNATVHLFRDVGVDYVIQYARRLGITSHLNRDLSLALGSSGLTLLELTRAYAVFPAGGRRVTPIFIRRVLDRDGNVLLENLPLGDAPATATGPDEAPPEAGDAVDVAAGAPDVPVPAEREQVIPPEQAYLVTDLLRAVVIDPQGTGRRVQELNRPVAGKTGTTNDQADAWFLGFSPDVATGVWVGHDETRFLGWGETGSRAAAPIFIEYMSAALAGRPVRDFPVPPSIVFARIDRKTGLLADAESTDTVFQSFITDSVPTESAHSAERASEGRRLLRMDAF